MASPDGKYSLSTTINTNKADMRTYLCVAIDIRDSNGVIIQHIQTDASQQMKWKIAWDSKNGIWLYSSDIGTLCWQVAEDKTWKSVDWHNNTTPLQPPSELDGI